MQGVTIATVYHVKRVTIATQQEHVNVRVVHVVTAVHHVI